MVVLRVWDDPQLVVVAILQHDHGDGTGVTFARRGPCARRLRVVRRQVSEVVPPATGGPAFPCLQALVRWDTEFVGSWCWGGPLPASGGGCGPGVRRRRYERVYPAQVWDPTAPLGRLVGVESPDPRFNEVVRDLCPGGDECVELSHKYLGCRGMCSLLLNFNSLVLIFDSLLLNFNSLLLNFNSLQVKIHSLLLNLNSLVLIFNSLLLIFNSLQVKIHSLLLNFNSLLLIFDSLLLNFNSLLLICNSLQVKVHSLLLNLNSLLLIFNFLLLNFNYSYSISTPSYSFSTPSCSFSTPSK